MKRSSPAKIMPKDVGIIHLIGIGGIGMSGIAEILHNLGYKVQGSDMSEGANVERLRALGISVITKHEAANVENAAVVVKSSAVKDTNPEIVEARKRHIPVVKRSEMLAEIVRLKSTVAIAGTHGKTTTTSLVAHLFEAAKMAPTVINGGIINTRGTNAYLGSGDWLVAEADESDGTFIKFPSVIGIITNIDPEHLEYYGSFDKLKEAFRTFVENLPFYGFAVMCKDHPEVKNLIGQITDRRILTYGITSNDVDVKAINIRVDAGRGGSMFDAVISARVTGDEEKTLKNIHLPMPGIHNVLNVLSAIAIGAELRFADDVIINGFNDFRGVKRRFTRTGEVDGIAIIDDYGHHPKEIAASLKTARSVVGGTPGKVIAVVQPHRYTRVHDLFSEFAVCFEDADTVFISEIYAAGETPIDGISQDTLLAAVKKAGHKDVRALKTPEELPAIISALATTGDLVICLGAGTVTKWANDLPAQLSAQRSAENVEKQVG